MGQRECGALAAGPGTLPLPARAPRVTHVGAPCAGCSPAAGTGTRGAARCPCRGPHRPAAAAPLLRGGQRAAAPVGAQPGKGEGVPRGQLCPTPRHGPTLPGAAAALGRNSDKLPGSQGLGLGSRGPVTPGAVRGQALLEEARTGAGGPTLTFKGAQQRLFPGHGLVVPQGQVVPRPDGNRERATGNGPRPRSGGNFSHTHTGVRVPKLKAQHSCTQ